MLRQHHGLLRSLGMSDHQLLTSHVASRLNGYMAGRGDIEQFEQVIIPIYHISKLYVASLFTLIKMRSILYQYN